MLVFFFLSLLSNAESREYSTAAVFGFRFFLCDLEPHLPIAAVSIMIFSTAVFVFLFSVLCFK